MDAYNFFFCLQIVEVKPGMRGRFVESGELCAEFPYRAKALFAFEEVDGIDVCFFGMHVQVTIAIFYSQTPIDSKSTMFREHVEFVFENNANMPSYMVLF